MAKEARMKYSSFSEVNIVHPNSAWWKISTSIIHPYLKIKLPQQLMPEMKDFNARCSDFTNFTVTAHW